MMDLFMTLTGLCCLLIVIFVGVILGNIAWNGWPAMSWTFLTKAPEQGIAAGGIFPAIFGTVFLVSLMTIAVIPLGGDDRDLPP